MPYKKKISKLYPALNIVNTSGRPFRYEFGQGKVDFIVEANQSNCFSQVIYPCDENYEVARIFCQNKVETYPVIELQEFKKFNAPLDKKSIAQSVALLRGFALGNKLAGHDVPITLILINGVEFYVLVYNSKNVLPGKNSGVQVSKKYRFLNVQEKKPGKDFELYLRLTISLKQYHVNYISHPLLQSIQIKTKERNNKWEQEKKQLESRIKSLESSYNSKLNESDKKAKSLEKSPTKKRKREETTERDSNRYDASHLRRPEKKKRENLSIDLLEVVLVQ